MKRSLSLRVLLINLFALGLTSCSTFEFGTQSEKEQALSLKPLPNMARIYFYRDSSFVEAFQVTPILEVNDKDSFSLDESSFAYLDIIPGKIKVRFSNPSLFANETAKKFDLKSGDIKFVKAEWNYFGADLFDTVEVSKQVATDVMKKLKYQKKGSR